MSKRMCLASVIKGPQLQIYKVSRSHMTEYVCIASNGISPDESWTVKLHVHCKPFFLSSCSSSEEWLCYCIQFHPRHSPSPTPSSDAFGVAPSWHAKRKHGPDPSSTGSSKDERWSLTFINTNSYVPSPFFLFFPTHNYLTLNRTRKSGNRTKASVNWRLSIWCQKTLEHICVWRRMITERGKQTSNWKVSIEYIFPYSPIPNSEYCRRLRGWSWNEHNLRRRRRYVHVSLYTVMQSY